MQNKKKHTPVEKKQLHPRNAHKHAYDFKALVKSEPTLKPFVIENKYGNTTIDFFNPEAVKVLNKALLLHFYGVKKWDIPNGYLCPGVPGRVDYLHYIADLLQSSKPNNTIDILDIGTGANCVYPLVGAAQYHWNFLATDIDEKALIAAEKTLLANKELEEKITLCIQQNKTDIFSGIILESDRFDASICNPPFDRSFKESAAGSMRKIKNLTKGKSNSKTLNFAGQSNELWCPGGEEKFVKTMVEQSALYAKNCKWFTCLISKETTCKSVYRNLKKVKAKQIKTIKMAQGNKISRFIAWSFLTPEQQKIWDLEKASSLKN